jgi:hypothetical protein
VLYVEDEPVPAAREAVSRLRRLPLILRFVTNTTSRSRPATLVKLRRLGFPLTDEELITPAALAVRRCLRRGRRRASLLMHDHVKGDFAELQEDDERPEAVIVGDLGQDFGYDVLNRAFRHVLAGAELVALQKNRYWRREDGLSLDVGPFVAALEYATGHDAHGRQARAGVLSGRARGCRRACRRCGDGRRRRRDRCRRRYARRTRRDPRPHGQVPREAVRASGIEPTVMVDSIADVPGVL